MKELARRLLVSVGAAASLVLVASCGGGDLPQTAEPSAEPSPDAGAAPFATPRSLNRDSGPAFDVTGISGWINSEAVSIRELNSQGKVVLVDFWTYTCVNCLRTLPFLKAWNAKYADRGLVILGVHTPEFEFEKTRSNVERAAADNGVTWPIAQDNDYHTWMAFGNQYWPAKYLIGADGKLLFTHFGEGEYVETEKRIRDALKSAGSNVDDIPIGTVNDQVHTESVNRVTREIYAGYKRNYSYGGAYAAQDDYYRGPDMVVQYTDPGSSYEDQVFYLHGLWKNESEAIVHARDTETPEDYLLLNFTATSVNVVISPAGPEPFDVYLEIDGRPVTRQEAGADVEFDADGKSLVRIDEPAGRLYSLLQMPYGTHLLKLASASANFAVYAFTFGVYESGI